MAQRPPPLSSGPAGRVVCFSLNTRVCKEEKNPFVSRTSWVSSDDINCVSSMQFQISSFAVVTSQCDVASSIQKSKNNPCSFCHSLAPPQRPISIHRSQVVPKDLLAVACGCTFSSGGSEFKSEAERLPSLQHALHTVSCRFLHLLIT